MQNPEDPPNHHHAQPQSTTTSNNNSNRRPSSPSLIPRILRRSSNSHISMSSDTDSQVDSFHSPLRFESPLRSDDPFPPSDLLSNADNSKAIVSVPAAADKYYSPVRSPQPPQLQPQKKKESSAVPPFTVFNTHRAVRDEVPTSKVVGHVGPTAREEDGGDVVGGERRSRAAVSNILRRSKKEVVIKKAALGIRISEVILCLISFSVMAADKTQGWSGDSFDRYKEYRYCLAVAVIGFVYSAFQAYDLAYHLATEKHVISHHLRYHFDFAMDQILAYLLISASSSAATRVDDWISNWGNDEFTKMASASVGMSFVAFVAFALSSLISGYNLCNRDSA